MRQFRPNFGLVDVPISPAVIPIPNLTPVDPNPTLTVDNPIKSSVFLMTNNEVPIPTVESTVGVAVKNLTLGATSDPFTPFNS